MYEYRQVVLHLRLGESARSIAKSGLMGRNKAQEVQKIARAEGWLNPEIDIPSDEVLSQFFGKKAVAKKSNSPLQAYHDEITQWVMQGVQASTIHLALKRKYGFAGSYNSVQRLVKSMKDQVITASTALTFTPGESVQVDFGMGPTITDVMTGEVQKTWIFVMVLSWSRHQYAEIVTNQSVATWVGCHRRAFEFFGGVPKRIIIDNPKCAITRACYHSPEVQRSYAECAEGYGFLISPCPPREPKKKGRVEAGVKYVKKNFVPLREFRGLTDANEQLRQWVLETAGNRKHGTTFDKPLNRFTKTEKYALKPLPDQPVELSEWKKVKVHGDCHVQFEKCRYSVPYKHVKQSLWLRASDSSIRIYQDYEMVAIHPRHRKAGSRHTIDEHMPPNAIAYKMRDPAWCLSQAKKVGTSCLLVIESLFADKVVDHLRAAQGIINLKKQYGASRLEAACYRAIEFETLNYISIKNILKAGVEYDRLPSEQAFDQLANAYTGGQYARDTQQLIKQ